MDPITLILSALAAGAIAGAKDTAADAVRDAYGALKGLVRRRLEGDTAREVALEKHEEDPEVWKEPLKKALTEAGADRDEEILELARTLLEQIPPDSAAGKYVTNVYGGEIGALVQGDHATVTVNKPGAGGQRE
jgi:hypothetical protein